LNHISFLTSSISRQNGGIFFAMQALSHALHEQNDRVDVFGTTDKDTEHDHSSWHPIPTSSHSIIGPKSLSYSPLLKQKFLQNNRDLIHLHGIYSYSSSICLNWHKKTSAPYLISPHGMLDPWILSRGRLKKKVAKIWFLDELLKKAPCLHSLCPNETQAIRDLHLHQPICEIPNGVNLPCLNEDFTQPLWRKHLPREKKVMLYLSRIHPKKNILGLIHGWNAIKHHQSSLSKNWHLAIAGWGDVQHEQLLKQKVNELKLDDSISFIGSQFESEKSKTFAAADAFILPSFSEGLPMAVLEAWSYQLPVIISKDCNFEDANTYNAALECPTTPEGIGDSLQKLFSMTSEERFKLGARGRKLVEHRYTWNHIAESFSQVYQWLLTGGTPPACIIK
jgi:poly(glycerol-phosphate) alpha-glucosyltransferase